VACGRIHFDPERASDSGVALDSIGDAIGDAAPSCAAPIIDDTFSSVQLCAPWGTSFMNAGAAITEGGSLVIDFSMVNANAGCLTSASVQLGSYGTSVEVAHAITGQDAYTALQLGDIDRSISVLNGQLELATKSVATVYASIAYDPVAMRWWRMRAVPGAIVGDYSPDGVIWTPLGSAPTTLAPTRMVVMAGVVTVPSADQAKFTHFIVCP
jgi:hypothetical protein